MLRLHLEHKAIVSLSNREARVSSIAGKGLRCFLHFWCRPIKILSLSENRKIIVTANLRKVYKGSEVLEVQQRAISRQEYCIPTCNKQETIKTWSDQQDAQASSMQD